MARDDEKYWYNFTTGKVEKGYESPAIDAPVLRHRGRGRARAGTAAGALARLGGGGGPRELWGTPASTEHDTDGK